MKGIAHPRLPKFKEKAMRAILLVNFPMIPSVSANNKMSNSTASNSAFLNIFPLMLKRSHVLLCLLMLRFCAGFDGPIK